MFQLTRRLQIALQKARATSAGSDWRPSFVAITRYGLQRLGHFDLLRWLCQRHGFGHFIQYIEGHYSYDTEIQAQAVAESLIRRTEISRAGIFVDTLISPSYELALAQTLQLPGISGLPNNSVLFEFDRDRAEEVGELVKGIQLAASSRFNVCVLRSTIYRFGYRSSIHIWISDDDLNNASLMILFAYIIVGHNDWRRAEIQLFTCFTPTKAEKEVDRVSKMMRQGRLPISSQKIVSIPYSNDSALEEAVRRNSAEADLVIVGLTQEQIVDDPAAALSRHLTLNDVLFVSASERISIL